MSLLARCAVVLLAMLFTTPASARTPRPHIVYINADDLGINDVGYTNAAFHTPHIDRLTTEGMTFTNAYAPAANCAPSRACVHSGQYGPRHGVYTVRNSDRGKPAHRRLIPTPNTVHLPGDVTTLAEALAAGGYQSIHLGKYHISPDPLADGFDANVGGDDSGSPQSGYYSPWPKGSMAGWSGRVPPETHRADIFTDSAIAFLEEHCGDARPMFVHFSPYLVHTPLTPVPEFAARYDGSTLNVRYATMVSKLDEAVGRLLDAIDRLKLAERTLVVFSSDNGGIASINPQTPYRGGKGSYYDGGIREPMIVRWPGVIDAGSRCDAVVSTLDLYPTFLAAASVAPPATQPMDGQSLLPLLTQQESAVDDRWATRPLFWHFPIYLQPYKPARDDGRDPLFRTRPGSVVRLGSWKLHEYFEDGALELYDLAADPGERRNLAATNPEKAAELHQRLIAWREQTGAPVPTQPNPAFDADAERRALAKVREK